MTKKTMTRRRFVATGAAAAGGVIAAPYVSTAQSAGTLKVGFWDHWVPGANKALESVVKAWGEKEKVNVEIDFITSQGNKILLTIAAEAQAKSGHDILSFPSWQPARLTGEQARYAWRRFEFSFDAATSESYLVMSRATDALGRTQPIAPPWNPSGYLWNAPDEVRIEVRA